MAYTLLQIRQALAEEAFSGEFPIRIVPSAGTTSLITIPDLAFGTSGATVNQYHGCWIYNTAAVPVAPFSSRVLQQAGLNVVTGALTVAPVFGSAIGTNEVIFCYDLHPDELHRAINRILRNLIYYAYLPVTLVPDGNLESDGVNNWAVVSGGTRAKTVSTPFFFGRNCLNVQGAVNAGTRSGDIPVFENESLLVSVPVRVSGSGSAIVRLHDETNNAAIKSVTVDETQPVTVQFYANAPSGCEAVSIRLLSGTSTSNFDVGPVTVLSLSRRRYGIGPLNGDAVAGFDRVADVKDVMRVRWGQSIASDVYYHEPLPHYDIEPLFEEQGRVSVPSGSNTANPMSIVLPATPADPVYMRVQARFPELGVTAALINAATNTTTADRDTIVQGAMHYIERARYARAVGSNPQLAAVHLGRSREYAQKFARMRQAQGYGIVVREVPQSRTTVAMS